MSYNNELYIFSEVAGYDASKGERIVKAFQKLREKIEHLEKVRMSEKNASLQKTRNNEEEYTLTDVQSELLLTQIRYITKLVREFGNGKQDGLDGNQSTSKERLRNIASHEPEPKNAPSMDHNEFTQEVNIINSTSVDHGQVMQSNSLEVINTETSQKKDNSNIRPPHKQEKFKSQPHYHLKLDDVPFILGASSSASHSVVANVQNIIALMKSHNRTLCNPKHHSRSRTSSNTQAKKPEAEDVNEVIRKSTSSNLEATNSETGDANEMLRKLSEDLTTLSQRQENLKKMFDTPQSKVNQPGFTTAADKSCRSKLRNLSSGDRLEAEKSMTSLNLKNKKSEMQEAAQKHSVLSVRMQTNNDPQLARRKMLRSLKDFKRHLSQEDISWE